MKPLVRGVLASLEKSCNGCSLKSEVQVRDDMASRMEGDESTVQASFLNTRDNGCGGVREGWAGVKVLGPMGI